jgi:hypothetical protein
MKRIITALALIAGASHAADIVWDVRSNPTNAAAVVSANARPVVGELDRIHVYLPANHTGTVSVAVASPFGGAALVVATNEATVGERVFVPRVETTDEAGAAALSLTNTGHRLVLSGETLTATISDVSSSNVIIRFRAVVKD